MSDNWCKRCGTFLVFGGPCSCQPFECKDQHESDEYYYTIYASDAETAATKYAEAMWEYDPYDPHKVNETIHVRCKDRNVLTFTVTAEAQVSFYAQEAKPQESENV